MPTIYKPSRRSDSGRRAERAAVYNKRRWRRLRVAKLMESPLCERCRAAGVIRAATEVHHVRSFMSTDDPDERIRLAYDMDNLMSVCDACHHELHGQCGRR